MCQLNDLNKLKCCKNCKYYFMDEEINDDEGKDTCYGHTLIATPYHFVEDIEKENNCQCFIQKNGESKEVVQKEWFTTPFFADETVIMLCNARK